MHQTLYTQQLICHFISIIQRVNLTILNPELFLKTETTLASSSVHSFFSAKRTVFYTVNTKLRYKVRQMASPPAKVLGAQVPSIPFYETDLKHFFVWGDASLLLHFFFFFQSQDLIQPSSILPCCDLNPGLPCSRDMPFDVLSLLLSFFFFTYSSQRAIVVKGGHKIVISLTVTFNR